MQKNNQMNCAYVRQAYCVPARVDPRENQYPTIPDINEPAMPLTKATTAETSGIAANAHSTTRRLRRPTPKLTRPKRARTEARNE